MFRIAAALLALAAILAAAVLPGIADGAALKILEGVHVVHPHTGVVEYDRTLVIRGDRIAAVAPRDGLSPPTDAEVFDVAGHFVMPGLAEMHAHVPAGRQGRRALEEVLFLWVANGITTARGMLGEHSHLALRDELKHTDLIGPRLITSGPSFNGGSVSSPEQAKAMAIEQAEAGYDFLKLHPGLELAEFDALAEAAHSLRIPFAGHVSDPVGLARTLAARQATIDHLDAYIPALTEDPSVTPDRPYGFFGLPFTPRADPARIETVARETAAAGVWNVPTQSFVEHLFLPHSNDDLASRHELRYVSKRTRAGWLSARDGVIGSDDFDPDTAAQYIAYRRQLIKALHDAGAGLLLGSDSPQLFNVPGFSIHHELAMLVEAGLTPAEALATGTYKPARFFGAEEEFGRIATGLSADLIVTVDNPLESLATLRAPAAVVLRGRWLSRGELDSRLAAIAARHSNSE